MRPQVQALTAILVGIIMGCAPKDPPRWQQGGAPLLIHPATWERGDDDTIQITAKGEVMEDGELLFVVDRVGRVVDDDYEPVALLLPDGHVAGTNNELLGRVGVANAAPPNSATAWLALMPNGQLVAFDEDGERKNAGVWRGCRGAAQRTCTYVSHMVWVRRYLRRRSPRVGIGVGIGVGY